MSASELLEQVLRLPESERAEIACQVLRSLEPDSDHIDPEEWEREWMAEIERRREQIRRGEAELLEWSEVKAHLEQVLKRSALP